MTCTLVYMVKHERGNNLMPSTPGIESEDTLSAMIECGPPRSQRERGRPSRFRDNVKQLFVSISFQGLRQVETVLKALVFFAFFFLFLLEGRCYSTTYHMLR